MKRWVWHPYMFAGFPPLFLYAHNIGELEWTVVIAPVALVCAVTFASLRLLTLVLKQQRRAAALISLGWLLFFSYKPVSGLFKGIQISVGQWVIGPHKLYLMISGLLLIGAIASTWKVKNDYIYLTRVLHVAASSLVLISLFSIVMHKAQLVATGNPGQGRIGGSEKAVGPVAATAKPPDIYYIILDGYGREDVLKELYGYDNGPFLRYLEQRGFYVAGRSKSNYQATFLSLASSLNLGYLDPRDGFQYERYRNNEVFSFLKEMGYQTIFISSLDSDVRMGKADLILRAGWLDNYHHELVNFTPIPDLLRTLRFPVDFYRHHRERVEFAFRAITETENRKSPFFVYAHIVSPHPPFLFGPEGEYRQIDGDHGRYDAKDFFAAGGTRDEYTNGYRDQIQYVNRRLVEIVEKVLSRIDSRAIIVLQGDHGPRMLMDMWDPGRSYLRESYAILNAYHLPDGHDGAGLYESITPVNTFRVLFNAYLNGRYGLLKDRSYYYNNLLSPPVIDVTIESEKTKS